MNTRHIMISAALVCAISACKVNDIALYDEAPRLELGGAVSYTFSDEEYLDAYILGGEGYSETEFTAQLIGYFLDAPRTFQVTTNPVASAFTPELVFENPYEFPTGTATSAAKFRIKCPSRENVSTRTSTYTGQTDIVYDMSSHDHQFGSGRIENNAARVNVVLQIYPQDWNNQFWGAYSTSKYIFMMETFKAVHGDIEQNNDSKLQIRSAYNAWKAENGPLYGDDEDSGTEIAFPL